MFLKLSLAKSGENKRLADKIEPITCLLEMRGANSISPENIVNLLNVRLVKVSVKFNPN